MMIPIRILIVDDHQLVRAFLRTMLSNEIGIEVVGEAGDGQAALDILAAVQPDVVLMDINMPGMTGLEAVSALLSQQPDLKILVVSACRDKCLVAQFTQAGVKGFFSKVDGRDEMIKAIHAVYNGRSYVSQNMTRGMPPTRKKFHNPFDVLTERELQVVLLLVHGAAIKDIAELLGTSTRTIQTHRLRVCVKLNLHNDVQLTLMAYRHGLLKKSA